MQSSETSHTITATLSAKLPAAELACKTLVKVGIVDIPDNDAHNCKVDATSLATMTITIGKAETTAFNAAVPGEFMLAGVTYHPHADSCTSNMTMISQGIMHDATMDHMHAANYCTR